MIDKAEQRRRAAEMSQTLASQGLQPPKLTYPVTRPQTQPTKKPGILYDANDNSLEVGDTVATTVDGIVSVLQIGKIKSISVGKGKLDVEIKMNRAKPGCAPMWHTITKTPSAVVKLKT